MAKLKRNHNKSKNSKSTLLRFLIFGIGVFLIMGILYINAQEILEEPNESQDYSVPNSTNLEDRYFLPRGGKGDIVHHEYYSLSYREEHEQAEWVAYELTKASLRVKNVKRAKKFKADYDVKSRSAFHRDYTHSGYTRGHMAPAGDMAFNETAMQESFYMSNMSPQIRALNNGIWKELEEQVRDWAYDDKKVYIVTGPMLNRPYIKRIGQNKVSVPSAFYKVILDLEKPKQKAIAFIIPHEMSDQPLQNYAVTIDDLEKELEMDLFADLMDTGLQAKLESEFNIRDWEFDKKRFKQRVEKWNGQ